MSLLVFALEGRLAGDAAGGNPFGSALSERANLFDLDRHGVLRRGNRDLLFLDRLDQHLEYGAIGSQLGRALELERLERIRLAHAHRDLGVLLQILETKGARFESCPGAPRFAAR